MTKLLLLALFVIFAPSLAYANDTVTTPDEEVDKKCAVKMGACKKACNDSGTPDMQGCFAKCDAANLACKG